MAQTNAPRAQAAANAGPKDVPAAPGQKIVQELKVSAHLMTLETGTFCIFNAPGTLRVDERTGFPGLRISPPPGPGGEKARILSFGGDGWIGGRDNAALVRIDDGPAEILITIYQREGAAEPAPKIQIQQLSDGSAAEAAPVRSVPTQADIANAEVAAHIQRRGDVVAALGEWMGERGSQRWIEGFSIAPRTTAGGPGSGAQGSGAQGSGVGREDVEYQAVLGRGWLSPWSEGGQYCGSRGMALPILGLRVRLKGSAAQTHEVRVSATFTDGSAVGPVDGSRTCEAESLAPLEAFQIEIVPSRPASTTAPSRRPEAADKRGAPKGPVRLKPVVPARRK